MTLCTEWLPKEIIDREIFKPGSSAVQNLAEAESDWRDWEQHFIISYTKTKKPKPLEDAPSDKDIDIFCKNLRTTLEMCKISNPAKTIGKTYYGELKDFMREFERGYNAFTDCRTGKIKFDKFQNDFPRLGKLIKTIFDERKKNPTFKKKLIEFMSSFGYKKIIDMLSQLPNEALMTTLNVDRSKIPRENVEALVEDDSDNPERKWLKRQRIYNEMLENEVAATKIQDRQVVLNLLHSFYEIRRLRNEINHASGNSEIDTLQDMIEKYLGELEKI